MLLAFTLIESPKFLITTNQEEKGFLIVEELTGDTLTEENKELIIRQTREMFLIQSHFQGRFQNYADLFNKRNLFISLNLFTLWYISSYVYYGLIYILPRMLEEFHTHDKNAIVNTTNMLTAKQYDLVISDIIMSCCFEIPSDISNGFVPNIKWIGRKGAIIIGFAFCVIFSIFCLLHPELMPLYASFIKFFINVSFNVLYIYTSEVYPTYMRSTSIGISNFFSRFGGFTTPFFNDYLFKVNTLFPYVGFLLTSLLGFFLSCALPYDTLNRITY